MYKYRFLCAYAAAVLLFFSSCSGGGTSASADAVIRKHPAPKMSLPQGEPQVMTFEALTRVVELSDEEILAAKQEAIANAAFRETAFAEMTGQTLKAQYRDGWLYLLQIDNSLQSDDFIYLTRTDGNTTERVGPSLVNGDYYTYYFNFDENGEVLFLHAPQNARENSLSYYSKYAVDGGGNFTETTPLTEYDIRLADNNPFYYSGSIYTYSPNDKALFKCPLGGAPVEPVLQAEVLSYNVGMDGKLYMYYKSDSPKFGIFDLNVSATEPSIEFPYNMSNIYGTSVIHFNPQNESYYRVTKNEIQTLDTATGSWNAVLALGVETEFQTLKAQGTAYQYADFLINEAGEFFIAVSEENRNTGQFITRIGKFVMK